jgi:hypothetical protein
MTATETVSPADYADYVRGLSDEALRTEAEACPSPRKARDRPALVALFRAIQIEQARRAAARA